MGKIKSKKVEESTEKSVSLQVTKYKSYGIPIEWQLLYRTNNETVDVFHIPFTGVLKRTTIHATSFVYEVFMPRVTIKVIDKTKGIKILARDVYIK